MKLAWPKIGEILGILGIDDSPGTKDILRRPFLVNNLTTAAHSITLVDAVQILP